MVITKTVEARMIIRKLRLQRGWSQEQLASLSGLNVRTIQRLERGQQPSLESKKCLAAVFEVDVTTFDLMDNKSPESGDNSPSSSGEKPLTQKTNEAPMSELPETVSRDEEYAMKYIAGLKDFYTHLAIYIPIVSIVLYQKGFEHGVVFGLAGWTLGIIVHGLVAHEKLNLFTADWERKLIEKKLGRKL